MAESVASDCLEQNDFICLSCNINSAEGSTRVALAAEGFGNRKCFTESLHEKSQEPPDLSICSFILEQALSVRALQEMINSPTAETTTQAGSRTLLYGHAVLLRHHHSDMYLSCLSSSSSNDKLAFDVGLTFKAEGESCWWTIHPASKQRSEGEKVRVGDDFILVSVSSERYLHIGAANCVIASFQQTLWTVVPVSSGAIRLKALGQVFGGDVLRIFHGDECLTLPEAGSENIFESVMYETGGVSSQARSLWRFQHVRVKWHGGFMGFGRPVRIRHVTSGRYLGVTSDHKLVTLYRLEANNDQTIFFLRESKDDKKQPEEDEEGMGPADIKYGDSTVVIQHAATGYWLSYQTYETKKRGIGKVEVKQAVMLEEGHMDDGVAFTRAQDEESRSALVIRKCTSLFSKFIKGLISLKNSMEGHSARHSDTWSKSSLEEVLSCLQDLIEFFTQPDEKMSYEAKQKKLHALRNRQNLFQEEGMIALVLDTIDQFSVYKSPRHFASYAGDEAAYLYEDISSYLYLLLASMIQGNRANCSQFAQVSRLDWLVDRLQSQQASTGVLKVLHCVLIDSPEALTMIKEQHIQSIISLLDKHGRDPKVLEVLCSLCVGNDLAVRTNQNLICDHLLPTRDLLLQTKVVDTVISMRPNIFIGLNEGAAMYKRWYYEVVIDHVEMIGVTTPHLRVGWANIEGYRAYPATGSKWGCNGLGDDFYSYAFDGLALWTGGKRKQVRSADTHMLQKGDVVGCCLDLSIPAISFSINGVKLKAVMKDFNMTGMFFPVASMSAKVSCRFMFGGDHGKLKHGPPEGYAPVYESLLPNEKLKIEPVFNLGDANRGVLFGPSYIGEHKVFVPNPIDTSHVQLPIYIESVRDKLAENIHELWALGKIEQGWTFGEYRDDLAKKHPCLTTFERLPASERQYDITVAFETLRTLLALGYHISTDNVDPTKRMKYQKLPASHLQVNGYKPMPLDLSGILLTDKLEDLVDQLAENTHNVWARDRIRQGWTYGQCDETENKRSCHLVPYSKVDSSIKKANRETASETIRTLLAYGYSIEPPNPEAQGLARHISEAKTQCRVVRPSKGYSVASGKWYFEFEVLSAGLMRVGWAKDTILPASSIGETSEAYVFDGFVARKFHGGATAYGKTWQVGDIVGCMIDLSNRIIQFSMNGELMMDMTGQEIAFKDITEDRYVPIIMLGPDQRARANYGQDPHSLKYYTCCGLQEGYEPFCINMTRPMPLWYVRSEGQFVSVCSDDSCDVAVTRVQKSASNCPAIKLSSKSFGTLGAMTSTEFIRVSLPVKCNDKYANTKLLGGQSDVMSTSANGMPSPSTALEDDRQTQASSSTLMSKRTSGAAMNRSFNAEVVDDDKLGTNSGPAPLRGASVDEPAVTPSEPETPISLPEKSATLESTKRKSKFNLFQKKGKSREPSPISSTRVSVREKEQLFTEGFVTAPPDVVPTSNRAHPMLSKGLSENSYGSDSIDLTAMELQELETNASSIEMYYFGLRLLPGQDANSVYVGWFTSNFNRPIIDFSPKAVRHVNLGALEGPTIKTSISRREIYVVHVGELVHKYGNHDVVSSGSGGGRDSSGTLVGCFINVSTGFLTFTLNGRELPNKYQVEPGTKLFPGVIYEPTCQDNLLFEIGRTRNALPISSLMFRGAKQTEPQCPSRLDLQILTASTWSRAPNHSVKVHHMKMSDIKGWSMLTEEAIGMLSINIPEEDRSLDCLELSEHTDMLEFHSRTLQLYCAICSHGNYRAAHELIKHVDEKQLMHAIQEPYLAGSLRLAYHNLLNAIHLDAHANIRLLTEQEYIFPLRITEPDSLVPLYREDVRESEKQIMKTLPSVHTTLTIRPKLALNEQELEFLKYATIPQLSSPLIPLDKLKKLMIKALTDGVSNGAGHIRDPIGGTCSHLFVPILKTLDNLLVMGLINDSELSQLLRLIDPVTFSNVPDGQGLLQMALDESVKVQLCSIFHHLCDAQVRHRVESIFSFSVDFVYTIQKEQLSRYQQITSSVMTPAVAAKRTKEFRSAPREQMKSCINFNIAEEEDPSKYISNPELEGKLSAYHDQLMQHCRLFEEEVKEVLTEDNTPGIIAKIFGLDTMASKPESEEKGDKAEKVHDTLQKLIVNTMINWSKDSIISTHELVRHMFSLLYRQYDSLGEILKALSRTYSIGEKSIEDLYKLMRPLCNIRSLLCVHSSKHEEEILKNSLAEIMDNKVFFQHPDLMRLFCVHETTMQLMVATLTKSQQESSDGDRSDMVVMCCKFLCYFCRISRKNQQAMFEHLGYLLNNSSMLLVRPSLRGSCPLDVAYSSLMDNNELALALRESHLERIVAYLSRAGVQSNPELLAAGYPDIGWDPVEGERFLDFLRFCVWVNGESVEENANLIVRLLIRRPECLGPALRGESGGGGLFKAVKYGIVMSEQIAAARDAASCNFLLAMGDNNGKPYLAKCKYDLSTLPSEDDEDYIDMGSAILSFYSTLVDLLARCAPNEEIIKAGRSDSMRARAILRSLVSMSDLEGILSLHFILPEVSKPDSVPPGLTPEHKASMVMFLERVYGIDSQDVFFRLLENGFLADLRTSTTLDSSGIAESDFALALNRYLCGSVLPLLTKHARFFENAEHKAQLMDSLLHTVYRLSKCRSLTAGQFRTVTDFLVAHTSHMRPIMMIKLLSMLTVDLPALTENTVISLRMLTHHYERLTTYYSHGHPEHGIASEEEKKLTMILFTRLFDALAQRPYEPELFSRALPCLAAIGCALSPDCAVTGMTDGVPSPTTEEVYVPRPAETKKVALPSELIPVLEKFAEHYHDIWCSRMLNDHWQYGDVYDEDERLHPNLLEFANLRNKEQRKLVEPAEDVLKALIVWGWVISQSNTGQKVQPQNKPNFSSMANNGQYTPSPIDLRNVSLSRDMMALVDKVADNQHAVWAKKKRAQLDSVGGGIHPLLVPYDMLTVAEKENYRKHIIELFKYFQLNGLRIHNPGNGRQGELTRRTTMSFRAGGQSADPGLSSRLQKSTEEEKAGPNMDKRFAFSLLEKFLEYVDKSAHNMVVIQSSKHFTKCDSFSDQNEEIKFFGKVVLLLMNKYFGAHQTYFMGVGANSASTKEKEMVASLFCKLSSLLRQKLYAFGSDIHVTVQCLVCICQAVDARSVVKNSADIVRTQLTPLFMNAAEDLTTLVENLKAGRFSNMKGTLAKGNQSLDYIHMVVLPVMSALFSHLAFHNFGADLLVNDIQLACYRILHSLYTTGAHSDKFVQRDQFTKELLRHRPALGECLASFAACFPVAFLEPKYNICNKYSIVYQVPVDKVQEHSLEAHEIMQQLAESIPELDAIAEIIKSLASKEGSSLHDLHIIEVTLPMLCSYLPKWWRSGPDSGQASANPALTAVTSDLMNSVLGDVLSLIQKHIGKKDAPWMNRIAMRTQTILFNAKPSMLTEYIIPMADKLCEKAKEIRKAEEEYCTAKRSNSENAAMLEEQLTEDFQVLVRDLYAVYPVLIRFVDLYRSGWIKEPHADAENLFDYVAKVFNFWTSSSTFRRSETTFVNINDIDNLALIMPSQKPTLSAVKIEPASPSEKKHKKKARKKEGFTSLVVAAIKRLLPIGLNVFGGPEQELVQLAKEKMVEKEPEIDIEELIRNAVTADSAKIGLGFDPKNRWQKALYIKMGKTRPSLADLVTNLMAQERTVERILTTAKVLYGLHLLLAGSQVEHPIAAMYSNWKKVISTQRKKAVMACFRMVPLHNLPRHRAINLFLGAYADRWLSKVEWNQTKLIEDLTAVDGEENADEGAEVAPAADTTMETADPLRQLVQGLSRQAQADQSSGPIADDQLYIQFSDIMAKSCSGEDDEEDEGGDAGDEEETLSFQMHLTRIKEQEMQKQKLLFEQGRLANRSVSEMLLQYISASKGVVGPMVSYTIDCGIALLLGGNVAVQRRMLEHLQEKKDVGFFTAMSGFMQQCSVLDLDAFERTNKAESLGVISSDGLATNSGENLQDADFTCKLFRFLQLLCEGHNADWQNYLRTQVGNNTTVNLVISTVDYLLRIQESMMDFYWHYSGKDTIDEPGKLNFIRAIRIGSQVFRTLTEYIQGPCQGNQLTLAHSRLWDAVGGFLFIFAQMQDKLSRDPLQLELLRQFMNLQKEMMIMLLSMLEGNVMNGPIGKQMVDTLVESSTNFEMILKFFDIFLKMKDMTTSDAFLEIDKNGDGTVSVREFKEAMNSMKVYTEEEIDYIMMCVDANQDGKVDFLEFTERFHNPAKDIGFNVALLLTNLAEHMPNDPRLERFLEKAKSVLDYFEPYLGRIEILGSAGRIERVYFEITQSHIDQWEKPQIKDSKRSFLHSMVNEGGENEKIGSFVDFCEDTIFEMQHATSISAEEQDLRMAHAKALRAQAGIQEQASAFTIVKEGTKTVFWTIWSVIWFFIGLLTVTNIKNSITTIRSMTFTQILWALAGHTKKSILFVLSTIISIISTFFKWILAMMMGEPRTAIIEEHIHCLPAPDTVQPIIISPPIVDEVKPLTFMSLAAGIVEKTAEPSEKAADESPKAISSVKVDPATPRAAPLAAAQTPVSSGFTEEEPLSSKEEDKPAFETQPFDTRKWLVSLFARNFYNLKITALVLAFILNFLLLFYRVSALMVEVTDEEAAALETAEEECEVEEMIAMDDADYYLELLIQILAVIHTLTSLSMLIAYYCLKVPLVIFKREKCIARKLEFEGMWIAEEPAKDELGLQWDRLVLSTHSFPAFYWDKFVKKKVKAKYSDQFEPEEINLLLNIEKSQSNPNKFEVEIKKPSSGFMPSFLSTVDWKYEIWKWGVIVTDNNFLYLSMYLVFSLIGNYNHFFFAAHLMDVAFSIKSLGTILKSVTHNGKQLMLTVLLLSVVAYIYSVIAFNFFRKFYMEEGEGEEQAQKKCHDLLTCFVFHLHTGVREGVGIGDEIEDLYGDYSQVVRMIFDISFFFFVIVILLAIIQGLIIDAFGDLRSQLEQVREDMESKCFICGIGKEYFDEQPHGFERHVMKEHNFANYMFFLMHLINKPDTEYTGQESYVWEMYNNRCWDFFPVGDCFRKQYDSEETAS